MKSLQIIQLGKYYPPATGGIETHTQTLSQGLAQRGHQVQVVVINHADRAGHDVTFQRFSRTASRQDVDGAVIVHRVGRLANIAKLDVATGLMTTLRLLLKQKPDIWHLHAPNITLMLAILAMPAIRPLVITHHSDIIRQQFLKHLVRPFEQSLYRRTALILSASPTYIDGSELLCRFRERVESLPLGLDLQSYLEATPESRAKETQLAATLPQPLWLCVGRLVYYKGLEVALKALQQLPGTLAIVGTGPMQEAWQRLGQDLGVADRVRWYGRLGEAELQALYRLATAYWFPSNARSEGFGLVQVEAMASGCPIINTHIPNSGVSWVSPHEQTGLTIPINDPSALVQASRRLLNGPGLRDRLSQEARRQAVERFSASVMVQRAERFYQQVCRQ